MAAGIVGLFGGHGVAASRWLAACWLVGCLGGTTFYTSARADDPPAAGEDAEGGETGLYLPTDRQQERQLDRAGRLIKDGRWSDAATLLDELLGAERDSFFRQRAGGDTADRGTWGSVKAEAARLIAALPPAGREAYQLQFRARAEKMLAEAVAADDSAAALAVARRWFATPAGQRAALLAAVEALEADQPLSAAAWLERLDASAAALEPTLAVMKALARDRAGDPAAATAILERAQAAARTPARIGGREAAISFPPGRGLEWLRELGGRPARQIGGLEWRQPRGDAGRNAIAEASRPLLVPRYRVPLARHPEEARRLETLRREMADRGAAAYPAGTPLAVAGTILVRGPLGLLAIDFDTGKRIWLQPGPRESDGDDESTPETLARTFDDFTGAAISSDGRLAFVVESHPDVLSARLSAANPFGQQREQAWQGGNQLAAYDLAAAGRLAWRLPAPPPAAAGRRGTLDSTTWFAGAPLVAGDRLYVVVEERAELRLDVLDAADGRTVWSQPLAELDEAHAITGRDAQDRRLAGAAPALGDGVLVCPLGAGTVVAVDLANRTLLWAHDYARGPRGGDAVRLRGFPPGLRGAEADGPSGRPRGGWSDDGPVIAAGRVLLAAHDSDELQCLDLRSGGLRWKLPRAGRLQVAGVVAGRAIVVARDGVEALDLDTGRQVWRQPLPAGVAPSGRGILTAERLFLPLDAPEVVEIALGDGTIVGRSPARGGAVPGNLVAYRGEVISLGVDSVDVFHQAAALETRIEAASRGPSPPAWAAVWAAQLALDRGDSRAALDRLRAAEAVAPPPAPDTLAAAVAFALARDFSAAVPVWRDCLPAEGITPAAGAMVRAVVDGAVAVGDLPEAWAAWRELFARTSTAAAVAVEDAGDPHCLVAPGRWLRGRLERLRRQAADPLRAEIDAFLSAAVATAAAHADRGDRQRALEAVADAAGSLAAGDRARRLWAQELAAVLDAAAEGGESLRSLAVRREFLLLDLAAADDAEARAAAQAEIAAIRAGLVTGGGPSGLENDAAAAWPLGRVAVRRSVANRAAPGDEARARLVPMPIEQTADSFLPGISAARDAQQSRLLFLDGFGRRLGDGVAVNDDSRLGLPAFDQATLAAAALGRVVFVRSGGAVTALEFTGRGARRLWTTAGSDASAAAGRFRAVNAPLVARNGAVPLGMRIVEPGDAVPDGAIWGRPSTAGLPLLRGRSLVVIDPVTGGVLWERHRLPAATDLLNDGRVACVVTRDGRRSPVLSLADGRILHEIDLPDRRHRLLAHGGRVLAIAGADHPTEGGIADTVRLEILDVADRSTVPLGEFAGTARACGFGAGMLAVADPSGGFTVIDLEARAVVFRRRLPEMPRAIEHLEVLPWEDSLLVCVGSGVDDAGEDDRRPRIAPLQQALIAGSAMQPLAYSVWAVDRDSGESLWQVPATVDRHCLLVGQPACLPVLVFARQIHRHQGRDSMCLSVLCLDKRTGHAVLEDDRIPAEPHVLFGADVVGDPERHTITVREHGTPQQVAVEFTGLPAPPRTPHQAGRPLKTEGLLGGVGRFLQDVFRPGSAK